MTAYRDGDGHGSIAAPTRAGTLSLTIGPRDLRLALDPRSVLLEGDFLSFEDGVRRRAGSGKKASERLGSRRLVVARDVPREDLGLWLELDDGGMRRVFGAEPVDLITEGGLAALRSLDALAARLRQALAGRAGGVRRAIEVGRGLDKVLLLDHGDRLVLYRRELFRDRARRACEVHRDGTILVVEKDRDLRANVRDRYGVSLLGDFIRFSDPTGLDLVRVAVPWVTREDREELARRFGELIHDDRPVDAASGS